MKKLTLVRDENGYAILYSGDEIFDHGDEFDLVMKAVLIAGVEVIDVNSPMVKLSGEQFEQVVWDFADPRFDSLQDLKQALSEDPKLLQKKKRIAELEAELKKLKDEL